MKWIFILTRIGLVIFFGTILFIGFAMQRYDMKKLSNRKFYDWVLYWFKDGIAPFFILLSMVLIVLFSLFPSYFLTIIFNKK